MLHLVKKIKGFLRQIKSFRNSAIYQKLNKSKGAGLDKIPTRINHECSNLISPYITIIFNLSLSTGISPDDWKSAKVPPIFKQGDKRGMINFRPISVISAIARVFERIVYNQLFSYLNEHNILSHHQSGLRSLHSAMITLLAAADNWAPNIDRGFVNAVVFLDLKKAFDTVNHSILLSKLDLYGIRRNTHAFICSYLYINRTQKCSLNGSLSESRSLTCIFPHGTILEPLLFLLYFNDLPNCLSSSDPRMYADDTHLTYADRDIDSILVPLNQDLININHWLIVNKLTLITSDRI